MITRFEFPEGATPISDYSGLKPVWVHTLQDLNRVEAENIMNAQRKYLLRRPLPPEKWFNVKELQTIHHAMFGEVWEWAGRYRKSTTSIGIKPGLIPAQLAAACHEVLSWFQYPVELTFVEMSARIHHRLVFIHPFENGNGRFSRFIADRFLLSWKCPHPLWPPKLNQEGLLRKDYIHTLRCADKGDYTPLVEFMKKLGAHDPKLGELFGNTFYRTLIKNDRGLALVNALLRNGANPNEETKNGQRIVHMAQHAGLDDIVSLLIDAGAT